MHKGSYKKVSHGKSMKELAKDRIKKDKKRHPNDKPTAKGMQMQLEDDDDMY